MNFCKVALTAIGIGAGVIFTAEAGPEPMPDVSKSTEMVEQTAEKECNWYISVGGGMDFEFGTTEFNRSREISGVFGLALIDVASHDFNDVYDTNFYRIQAEFGYALGQHVELFGMLKYSGADSQTTGGSEVFIFAGDAHLRSEWSDYTSFGGEVGIRVFFLSRRACVRPYISFSGGGTHVDSIDLETRVLEDVGPFSAGDVVYDGNFYDDSVVATGAILAGVEVPVTRCFAVGADAGFRYESKLTPDDGDLDEARFDGFEFPRLNKLNDNAGDRFFCPVTIYAKVRF